MKTPKLTAFVLALGVASFGDLFGQDGSLVTPSGRLPGVGSLGVDTMLVARYPTAPNTLLLVPVLHGPISRTEAEQNDTTTKEVCFRGRPLPYCRWFVVTEVGYSVRLATTSDAADGPVGRISIELGGMRNLGPRSALGATLFFLGLDADESRAGVRARYRRWLKNELATEVAAGVLLEANDVPSQESFDQGLDVRGFSGQVAFDYRNIIGLNTQVDVVDAPRSTQVDWYVGARVGSGVGAAGAVALAAVTLIGILVMLGSS